MKEFLSTKRIPYTDHDINKEPGAAQEVVRLTGQNGIPVMVIDGQTVVGFDQPRIEQLIEQSQSSAPVRLGAAVGEVDKSRNKEVPINFGAFIGRVSSGSIAEKAGLAAGDIIIQLNNQGVSRATHLELLIAKLKHGDKLNIVFIRGNIVNSAEITL